MTPLDERYAVELPLIEQLKGLGWAAVEGDIDVPDFSERQSFRQVILPGRFRAAIKKINKGPDGAEWLDDARLTAALHTLERLEAHKLIEANQLVTDLLILGTQVDGLEDWNGGKDQTIRFIDFDNWSNNDFLVVSQFRVDRPAGLSFIVVDIVLFVNGIPLVVIECKSPAATNPMEEGINQLLRYSNQRHWIEDDEGVERLFHFNQLMISTYGLQARMGTVGAQFEHYLEWKDTSPVPMAEVAASLGKDKLSSQEVMVAGLLRPAHLLDVVRNFILFQQMGGKTIKIAPRYQQFRAVHEALRRLKTGKTKPQDGLTDRRGGIVWHTQGSGKSLTMVFMVRKMRTDPALRAFKVVIVTDRTDLQSQLRDTARLTNEVVRPTQGDKVAGESATKQLQRIIAEAGADLVFAMIQKWQERDEDAAVLEYPLAGNTPALELKAAEPIQGEAPSNAKVIRLALDDAEFPELNTSEQILVVVDEAHRSQSGAMHANLRKAMPNCAMIGFTGTPILAADKPVTEHIFGPFIDRYTLRQSEADGATVPILYEGRTSDNAVTDERGLDALFEDMFKERSKEELAAIQAKYATKGNVLEAEKMIAAKARDMLWHYVTTVLPNGGKAQVVAVSRLAAIRYEAAFRAAQSELLSLIDALDAADRLADIAEIADWPRERQVARLALSYRAVIADLAFAVVISGSHNDDPAWKEWSDSQKKNARIERFKKPLFHDDPTKQDRLAFLCVKSMLLTGFDAPVEQVMYLDRMIQGAELLQAIARVNRTHQDKRCGLVVDYYGVGRHLKQALAEYAGDDAGDTTGAMEPWKDELPKLADRHHRAMRFFKDRGIADPSLGYADCVDLLADMKLRAEFGVLLRQFLESLDIVLPRPEGLPYVRDAKVLGFINKAAANLYRDDQLNIAGLGNKVRALIDEYIEARDVTVKVPPISITDEDFDRAIEGHVSDRAKASEMEHAARHHIKQHFEEDPSYYKSLSERLEGILKEFEANWAELLKALQGVVQDIRDGRKPIPCGLDPRTEGPFFGVLQEESGLSADDAAQLTKLCDCTREIVAHVRQEIQVVEFWRKTQAQQVLRAWLNNYLLQAKLVPFGKLQGLAERLMQLSRVLHSRLVA
jgi:type I restriction enzyme R subunit